MDATRRLLAPALAATLMAFAIGLWLSAAPPSRGASANHTQGVSLAVPNAISWGSVGTCSQSMAAYDFGSVSGGAGSNSSVFTGCVSSNATWQVSASMTTAPSNGSTTVPASSFVVRDTTAPLLASVGCGALNTTCTLDSSRTLFSGAQATTGNLGPLNQFTYSYNLTVPSDQASGSYTGGVVTFVASN